MRSQANRTATLSSSPSNSHSESSCCKSILRTIMPLRGKLLSTPWACKASKASRTGVRETLYWRAKAASSIGSPGSNSPAAMAASRRERICSLTFMGLGPALVVQRLVVVRISNIV